MFLACPYIGNNDIFLKTSNNTIVNMTNFPLFLKVTLMIVIFIKNAIYLNLWIII